MTNQFPEEIISSYLDGELSPLERSRVEAWLAESPEHQRMLDDLRLLRRELQALPKATLGGEFSGRVIAAIEARMREMKGEAVKEASGPVNAPAVQPAETVRKIDRQPAWQFIAASVAVVILAVGLSLNWRPNPTTVAVNHGDGVKPEVMETQAAPAQSLEAPLPMAAAQMQAATEREESRSMAGPSAELADAKSGAVAGADSMEDGHRMMLRNSLTRNAADRNATPPMARKRLMHEAESFKTDEDFSERLRRVASGEESGEVVIEVAVDDPSKSERLMRQLLAVNDSEEPEASRDGRFLKKTSEEPLAKAEASVEPESLANAETSEAPSGKPAFADEAKSLDVKEIVVDTTVESVERLFEEVNDKRELGRVVRAEIASADNLDVGNSEFHKQSIRRAGPSEKASAVEMDSAFGSGKPGDAAATGTALADAAPAAAAPPKPSLAEGSAQAKSGGAPRAAAAPLSRGMTKERQNGDQQNAAGGGAGRAIENPLALNQSSDKGPASFQMEKATEKSKGARSQVDQKEAESQQRQTAGTVRVRLKFITRDAQPASPAKAESQD